MIRAIILTLCLFQPLTLAAQLLTDAYGDKFEFSLSGNQLGDPIHLKFQGARLSSCLNLSAIEITSTDEIVIDPESPFGKRQDILINISDRLRPSHPGCDAFERDSWQIEAGRLKAPTLNATLRFTIPASNTADLLFEDILVQQFQLFHVPGATLNLEDLTTLDEPVVTYYANCEAGGHVSLFDSRANVSNRCLDVEDDWQIIEKSLPRLQSGLFSLNVFSSMRHDISTDLYDRFGVPGHTQWTHLKLDVRHAVPTEASGLWYTEDNPGTGLTVLVLDDTRIIAIWYTLDPDGNLVWVYGDGHVQAPATPDELDVTVQFDAFEVEGAQSNPMALKDNNDLLSWGTWTMVFSACDQARFSWQANRPSWPDGEVDITQLAGTTGQDCVARR